MNHQDKTRSERREIKKKKKKDKMSSGKSVKLLYEITMRIAKELNEEAKKKK